MARRPLLRGDTLPLLGRLWREWLSPHRATLAVVLVLITIVGAATGLYPALIKAAFDAFDRKDMGALAYGPLIVIAVTSARGFALFGQTVLTNRVVTRVEADMQAALYAHLIDADLAQLGRESPAAFTQRFTTDFAFIKEALTRISTVLLRDVAMLAALVIALIWMDPLLTLAAAVTAPLVAGPVNRIGKRLRQVSTTTQEQMGATASLITESLQGARVAKTYALEGYLKGRAAQALDEVRRLKMKAANARGRLDPLMEVGGGLAVAGVLVLVGQRVMSGDRTVGDFTGYVAALLLAAQPARALGTLNAILQEAAAALSRYFALMDEPPTIREVPSARPLAVTRGEIRFEGVHFRYRADAPALEGIDLVVPAGSTTALVGRSGSGKSSLLNLVPRLQDVTAGRVLIDGTDIRDVTIASLRSAIAVVSQEVVLFDDTIAANIGFGRPGASQEEIEAAAGAAAAHGFITRLSEGYAFRVGPGGGRLSGGERQRISLARAFLKNAPILLLDEATSALDSESEHLVQEALERLMRGRTTLVIAHRLSTVREADRIAVLEAGRVIELGRHEELVAAGGTYARLHRLQLSDDTGVPKAETTPA
ncbi:MAG TPA: ABC transporter ATP-binding protein [Methylobacterium sp.]|jgi:subfamily B ATP-binding cassette protein MsbA|uniref:ABC transporter ATP-binding protein n=1 Tax=Methylorubrum sp. B1-46 TaxID=2897334 RepID=UPI001E6446A9|nr:ABC transporter ATP-binding protein [Methylorubrum sp. B1-46]UGB24144.1 ABC transporter ATP-binding protein/permease [Methylorubrum sp. B1-46]HEV2542959.1 ABC transporter ATP-binding protein [Methylobacterium sp.]